MKRIRNWCTALTAIAIAILIGISSPAWAANHNVTAGSNNDGNTILIGKSDNDIGATIPDCGSAMATDDANLMNDSFAYGEVKHAIYRPVENPENLVSGNMPSIGSGALKPDNYSDEHRAMSDGNILANTATRRLGPDNRYPLLL